MYMTIKKCTCGEYIKTTNAIKVIRMPEGLWYTCCNCKTTGIKRDKSFSLKEYKALKATKSSH